MDNLSVPWYIINNNNNKKDHQACLSWSKQRIFPQLQFVSVCLLGIVHENVKMGSDGESDHASGTSSDEVQSPVRVRMRNNHHRRISNEVWRNKERPHSLLKSIPTFVCQQGLYRIIFKNPTTKLPNPHVLSGFQLYLWRIPGLYYGY